MRVTHIQFVLVVPIDGVGAYATDNDTAGSEDTAASEDTTSSDSEESEQNKTSERVDPAGDGREEQQETGTSDEATPEPVTASEIAAVDHVDLPRGAIEAFGAGDYDPSVEEVTDLKAAIRSLTDEYSGAFETRDEVRAAIGSPATATPVEAETGHDDRNTGAEEPSDSPNNSTQSETPNGAAGPMPSEPQSIADTSDEWGSLVDSEMAAPEEPERFGSSPTTPTETATEPATDQESEEREDTPTTPGDTTEDEDQSTGSGPDLGAVLNDPPNEDTE